MCRKTSSQVGKTSDPDNLITIANFPEGIPIGAFGLEGGEDGVQDRSFLNEELGSILEVTVLTPASEFQSQ